MKAESVDNEFTDRDIIFINIEFNSIASCEMVKRQAQLFLNGTRVLSDNHYSNLKIGIRKSFVFYKKEYERQSKEETRPLVLRAIKEMSFIAKKLVGIKDGSIHSELEYEDNGAFLRASRFGLDPVNNWYEEVGKGVKRFDFSKCGKEILEKAFPGKIITEYKSELIHVYFGNRYLQDGEPFLRSLIQHNADVDQFQITRTIEYIRNSTRVVDPKKIDKTMEQILPLPPVYIPISNGILDSENGVLMDFSPKYYYTSTLPRTYIPGGKCKRFRDFLNIVFTEDPKKELKIQQIYETFAWTLTGEYTIQGAVSWIGLGGEGKGIISKVLENLLGTENVSSVTLQELDTDKFKRAELYGKFANIVNEAGGYILSEYFKKFTDFSPITADRKNGNPFKYCSRAKMLILTNELPDAREKTRAFYRRILLVVVFQNFLENLLNPNEINSFVKELGDPHELDLLFSEIVDDYLTNLLDRKKFTGQLTISDSEETYKKYSNPSQAYIDLKVEKGLIFTDYEEAIEYAKRSGIDIDLITKEDEKRHGKVILAVKKFVERDAKKWANEEHLQPELIDTVKLGKAIEKSGYPNITTDKKIEGSKLKAWSGIFIALDSVGGFGLNEKNKKKENGSIGTLDQFTGIGQNIEKDKSEKNTQTSAVPIVEEKPEPEKVSENALSNLDRSLSSPMLPLFKKLEDKERREMLDKTGTDEDFTQKITSESMVPVKFEGPILAGTETNHSISESCVNTATPAFPEKESSELFTNDLKPSYKIQQIVLDISMKMFTQKSDNMIEPSALIENWPSENMEIIPDIEDLNERILPFMAGDGLLSVNNGKIIPTGKKLKVHDNSQINKGLHYLLISVLEELPPIAWSDRNYFLHKGDIIHIPEELAKTLINRGWAVRIIEPKESIKKSQPESIESKTKAKDVFEPTTTQPEEMPQELKSIEPATEDECIQIRDMLLNEGMHLKASETRKSYDGRKFQIAFETRYFNQNRGKIETKMGELGFIQSNTGSLGIVFFNRPLK